MLPAPLIDESKIPLIKMKIAGQLDVVGFSRIASVILLLLTGQKINGHISLPA